MTFEHPYLLLLLLPVCLCLFLFLRRKEPAFRVPNLALQTGDGKRRTDWRKLFPFICYAAAAFAVTFALARPVGGREVIHSAADGIDIMIVLDISGSMLSFDASPREIESGKAETRLAVAKKEIAAFIRQRPNDRIGLIRFADGPDTVCPPTLDHAWLLSVLASLKPEPELLGSRTGIAAPVLAAADSLSRNSVIVLFTDGRDNIAAPLTPEDSAVHAAKQDIRIYTVGIGSQRAYAVVPDIFGGAALQRVGSDFDGELLQKIADLSGGKYYTAADAAGMNDAMTDISRIEKTVSSRKNTVYTKEYYPVLALAAAGFVLLGVFLQRTALQKLP